MRTARPHSAARAGSPMSPSSGKARWLLPMFIVAVLLLASGLDPFLIAKEIQAKELPAKELPAEEQPANEQNSELDAERTDPSSVAPLVPQPVEDRALQLEFFERKVRPLLIDRCGECHSRETGPDNGGLVLDSPAGILAGGSRGPALVAHDPDQSLLMDAVRYTDVELQMPPDGKLTDGQRAVLEEWIRGGAVMPAPSTDSAHDPSAIADSQSPHAEASDELERFDLPHARDFWSFRPLPPVSAIPKAELTEANSVVGERVVPIDRFIADKLNAAGLKPSPPATRLVWIRRVTFDCVGLPPTPAEIQAFLQDGSDQAYERVVDRLLASPQFGERWGRVWLDLSRYTDETPSWQSPTDRGWIYRDWVVRAWNESRPYDTFVRQQLAADRMSGEDPRDLAALGFLGLSPTYWKELRLAPGVIQQIVADEWDERLDTVTRTFLGLTVACARCHDHKFDPISTEDYYALAGVFASSQIDERPLVPDGEVPLVIAHRRQRAEVKSRLKTLREQTENRASLDDEIEALERQLAELERTAPDGNQLWAHTLREASLYVEPDGEEMTKLVYREGEPRDLPVYRRGNPLNPGAIVPRRFLRLFAEQDQPRIFREGSGRGELADAILNDAQGLAARVIVNRIWDQHFQSGLVRTTSDFGSQGERPSHPELLDDLATQLVRHDWDLKWLHRQIVLSATYRQSSDYRAEAFAVDPENRLMWRMNRRRLDVEMWRDATLSVSGQLDLRMQGPSRPIDELANRRRTIYATVQREDLHPMLRMHDFPEASSHAPRRTPTVTPLQQLFVLNSPWLEEQARQLHLRLAPWLPEQRIEQAYWLLFARPSTSAEANRAFEYLQRHGPVISDANWQDYWQALLGLNEFHFVD